MDGMPMPCWKHKKQLLIGIKISSWSMIDMPCWKHTKQFLIGIKTFGVAFVWEAAKIYPSNAEATFIQSARTQRFCKTIETMSWWFSLNSSR